MMTRPKPRLSNAVYDGSDADTRVSIDKDMVPLLSDVLKRIDAGRTLALRKCLNRAVRECDGNRAHVMTSRRNKALIDRIPAVMEDEEWRWEYRDIVPYDNPASILRKTFFPESTSTSVISGEEYDRWYALFR